MASSVVVNRPQGFFSKQWPKLVAALIWTVLLGPFLYYVNLPGTDGMPRGIGQAIFDLIQFMQTTVYGPLIFILLYALRPLAFFSAALLTISGGFLFGPLGGVAATAVGANLSAALRFCNRSCPRQGCARRGRIRRLDAPLC